MSKEDDGGNDFESLFEGMVLFSPSSINDSVNQHQQQPSGSDNDPIPIPTPTTSPPPSIGTSQPLDENLFSDLTIVDQNLDKPTEHEQRHVPTPSISPQLSRKKKRVGSLRIGYGRDSTAAADNRNTSSLELEESVKTFESAVDVERFAPPAAQCKDAEFTSSATYVDIANLELEGSIHDRDEALSNGEEIASSTEDRYERLRVRISEKLTSAQQLAASVSAAKKDLIRKRRKAAEEFNLASIKHAELESKLEEACEAEEFEMAESLSESLAVAEMKKTNMANTLRDAEAECDAIDFKMQQVLEQQISAEEECVRLLEDFSTEAENSGEVVLLKAKIESSKGMDEWISSAEAVESKKMELEIETHLISEARLIMNGSIDNLILEEREQREFLCKRREVLTDELEKLLILVKEKEKEIEENDCRIKEVEGKMDDVVTGFQDMLSSIDARCDLLRSGLSHMESESEALITKKKELDHLISQETDRGERLLQLARVSAEEAKAYKEQAGLRKFLIVTNLKSGEDRVRLAKSERQLAEDVDLLRQEVSAFRASLQGLASSKSTIQQEISSHRQKIIFIDKRVPELEAEKKVAATARNFKEAARIATEAKTLGLEKEGVNVKLEEAMLKLEEHEEQIKDTVSQVQDMELLILSKEKELALARFQWLILAGATAKAERSAALVLGDIEEANVLLLESEAAFSEAGKLQPSHNFREEELSNLPKSYISMELVSNLSGRQLAELAASVDVFPSE